MTKSVKKFVILLVALLMCATVVFAACSKTDFKPVDKPNHSDVLESNGGVAVKYGEWLYYVNGYQSSVSVDNTYSNEVVDAPRVGSVVRIRLSDLDKLLAINDDDDLTSSAKADAIAAAVRAGDSDRDIQGAETVIPKVYFSANSTSTQFTGIFIFDDRIYVTTPNDALTANGDPLTSQLVLMSFDLGGGDPQSHFTFTSNSAQIWLTKVGDKLVATYLMDNVLHTLDVASGKDEILYMENDPADEVENIVSSVNWDVAGNAVFFLDKFGSICKASVGSAKYDVIIENTDWNVHNHDGNKEIEAGSLTYTIKSVNKGIVYYTEKNTDESTSTSDVVLFWAESATNKGNVTLPTTSISAYGWDKDKVIITKSKKSGSKTYYSICKVETVVAEDGTKSYKETPILAYGENDTSITIDKLVDDTLYYTADSVAYTLNLASDSEGLASGTPYGKSLASATGWAAPDFFEHDGSQYVITLSSGSVTLVKFNPEDKTNSDSVALTLTAEPEEE